MRISRLEEAFRPGSVPRIEVEETVRHMKVLLSRTDNTDMYRRAFARHRTGAALLVGLSFRAPSASAERAEPDALRVGTVEGNAAEELPSAAETPPLPAAPIVPPRPSRDEGVAYSGRALGERFYERVEIRLILERDASGHVRRSSVFEVPDATLVGQLTDAVTGLPVAGARLQPELDGADAPRASTLADGSVALPTLRGGTATVRVESSRQLARQTNVQLVPGDEARVPFALSPRVELPGVAEAALELTVRGQPSAPSSSYTREEVRRIPAAFGPAPSGEASLRLFDLGGLIGPTVARGRGRLIPALVSLLIPEVKLDNRDHPARATYEPSARDRFSAFGYGSCDLLGEKSSGILTRLGDAFRPKITFTW